MGPKLMPRAGVMEYLEKTARTDSCRHACRAVVHAGVSCGWRACACSERPTWSQCGCSDVSTQTLQRQPRIGNMVRWNMGCAKCVP